MNEMKKTISILLVALSLISSTAFAESTFRKGERINNTKEEASNAYYSGKYLLRKGERIEQDPKPKSIPDGRYSGKYLSRQGQKIELEPQPKHIPDGSYSGKYILRQGTRTPS